jgi:hypothetical protein
MSQTFTPFCLRTAKPDSRWREFNGSGATRELATVKLVVEAPEFLGLAQPDQPLPRAAVVSPQAASNRVLLAVTESGGVMVVACPDTAMPASGLVGEVLAASGRMWRQPYTTLAEPFESFLGMSLTDWIGRRTGPGWSAESFRAGAEACLRGGRFPVLLLVEKDDPGVQEAAAFLVNMNLEVRLLSWDCFRFEGVELVRPREIAARRSTAESVPPVRTGDVQATPPSPGPQPEPASSAPHTRVEEHTSAASIGGVRPGEPPAATRQPFPDGGWSDKQKEMLGRLVDLDMLGLTRRGFEYFTPGSLESGEAEGAIVVSVQADRWPAPGREEVIVVVRTDPVGAWLKTKAQDIEDFLSSLRRAQRKEHKGAMLLLVTSGNEATQVVNELKALKELASSAIG